MAQLYKKTLYFMLAQDSRIWSFTTTFSGIMLFRTKSVVFVRYLHLYLLIPAHAQVWSSYSDSSTEEVFM